jgi:hypothetical protein
VRLNIENLEDRRTPAVFLVTNLSDAGPGSLRDAINQVDAAPAAAVRPVIEFAPTLAHQTISLSTIAFSDSDGANALDITKPVLLRGTGQTITRAAGAPTMRLLYVDSPADVVLDNLTFTGSKLVGDPTVGGSAQGGAIFSIGRLYVDSCTFVDNQAIGGDGNAANDAGDALGGAIANSGDALTVVNSTFTNNLAAGGQGPNGQGRSDGAAIYSNAGQLTITHSTIVGNRVTGDTVSPDYTNGSVYVAYGRADLINSIVAGTVGAKNDIVNWSSVISDTQSIVQKGAHTTHGGKTDGIEDDSPDPKMLQVDPLVGPLADNGGYTQTMALLPGSPALGVAQLYGSVTVDQRGVARNLSGTDLGSYEVQHPLSPVGVPADVNVLFGPKPNANADEAFVRGLYQATLLRAGDASEVAYSVNLLHTGAMTRSQLAASFYNSPENRGNQVKFFYSYFLGRSAGAAEIDFSVKQLQAGVDEGALMANFILSPEYTGKNDNHQFVETMYYSILGRGASDAEVNFSVSALDAGQVSRPQVLASFLASPEGLDRVVQSDYGAYLKRQATPAELATAAAQIQAGATVGSIAFGLLGSAEFYSEASANVA